VVSSFEDGGAEWVALRLAAAQLAAGHEVEVIALRDGPLRQRCEELGVPAYAFHAHRMQLAAEVALHFARRRFDVVNSHNPPAHRFAQLARASGFAPLVMTRHGEQWPWARAPRMFAAPVTDGVIAVSARVRSAFLEHFPDYPERRLIVIENGIEAQASGGDEPLRALREGGRAVLYVAARLDPVKDLGTLLRAFALARRGRNVVLAIAGDGPERSALTALARDLEIDADVHFLGFRDDAARLYTGADVFVLSSLTEGLSLSTLEAMAAGLPVVATRVGGNPELILDGETGLLVPPRDPEALAGAIGRVLDDAPLRARLGTAGRARAAERFSLRETTRRYLDVYGRLIGAGARVRLSGRASLFRSSRA
jgi:glycosyltransferase involved in cell wall biosynthesis